MPLAVPVLLVLMMAAGSAGGQSPPEPARSGTGPPWDPTPEAIASGGIAPARGHPATPVASFCVAPSGADGPACGTSPQLPCATLRYTIGALANAVVGGGLVSVVLAPGSYNSSSCGATGTRALNITGAGSGATVVDCAYGGRVLSTNDSLAMSGLTPARGLAAFGVNVSDVNATDVLIGGGGGAVAVTWLPTVTEPYAVLDDVAFVSNAVLASVVGNGTASVTLGGGGLFVSGGGNGSVVLVTRCTWWNNTVVVQDRDDSLNGVGAACGGGACVALGVTDDPAPLLSVSVVIDGGDASWNTISCGGRGACSGEGRDDESTMHGWCIVN